MRRKIRVVMIGGMQVIQVSGIPDFPVEDDELDEFIDRAMKNIGEGEMIEKMIQEAE